LTVRGSANEKGELIDMLGQALLKFDLTAGEELTLDLKKFAKGVYFLRASGRSVKIIVK